MTKQIAQTILTQLGGNKFIAMTGAKNMVAGDNRLTFRIGRGARNGINGVRVTIDAYDLYTVEFFKARGINFDVLTTVHGVGCEKLVEVFELKTGMKTSL